MRYATALDWFIICSFTYCMATLLEFAGVHYFTKVVKFDWVEFILVEIVGSGKQIFVQHFSLLEM